MEAHLIAARLLLPRMAQRGSGHLLLTASAAGLLTQPDNAPYAVSKHATVALAEWLAIAHADAGVGISCLVWASWRVWLVHMSNAQPVTQT